MDSLIYNYIHEVCHPDAVEEILSSFILFNQFSLEFPEGDFIDILMNESNTDQITRQAKFVQTIHNKLDFIIKAHEVELVSEATLRQKNAILFALYKFIDIADYSRIKVITETQQDPAEVFSEIIAHLSVLTEAEVFSLVSNIDPNFIKNVKSYLEQRDIILGKTGEALNVFQNKVIDNYKKFLEFYKSTEKYSKYPLLSQALLEADLPIGRPLDKYKTYYGQFVNYTEIDELLINLMGFLLLTEEGYANLFACFRKNSNLIFSELDTISRVDTGLMKIMGEYTNYLLSKSDTKEKVIEKE